MLNIGAKVVFLEKLFRGRKNIIHSAFYNIY